MSRALNALIARAGALDHKELNATYQRARQRVIEGKNIDKLNSHDSLMFCGALRQMVQDRAAGAASQKEDSRELAARLAKDTGITFDQAVQYIKTRGNPYQRNSKPASEDAAGSWDGVERRGIRKPGFTAADLDAADERDFSQPQKHPG